MNSFSPCLYWSIFKLFLEQWNNLENKPRTNFKYSKLQVFTPASSWKLVPWFQSISATSSVSSYYLSSWRVYFCTENRSGFFCSSLTWDGLVFWSCFSLTFHQNAVATFRLRERKTESVVSMSKATWRKKGVLYYYCAVGRVTVLTLL